MEIMEFLQSFSSNIVDWLMLGITFLGSLYVSVFIISIIYWCYSKEIGYKMAVLVSFSAVLNNIVKNLVQAIRPVSKEEINFFVELTGRGYSFPSGHAQNITTLGSSLYIFTRIKLVFFVSSIIILLVSLSRVYLGLHRITDIIGGIVLALLISIVLNEIFIKLNKFQMNIFVGILFLIGLLGIFLVKPDEFGEEYFRSFGLFIGIYLGHLFESRFVDFSVSASNIDNLMKIFIGVTTTLLLEFLLRYLLNWSIYLHLLKYFIIGFWIIGIIPLIFKLTKLYYKDAYEITNTKYRK